MPKYDYVCSDCLSKVEVSMSYEQAKTTALWCRHCAKWMTRQIQQIYTIFKGPGFYCTDNQEEHKEEEQRS